MHRLLKVILSLACLFTAFDSLEAEHKKYKIVSTIGMITDVVKEIAGDRAEVHGLIGSGVDPHLFKPTRSDIATLHSADVVFYNGLLLEGKMSDALVRVAMAGKKVYAVTEQIAPEFLLEPEEFQGHYDPHLWMDPKAWAKTVDVIAKALAYYDAESAKYYAERRAAYRDKLVAADKRIEAALMSVPKSARILVTAHDAFNYFGKRYSYDVRGIQGLSTESEAGVRDIEKLVDLLVQKKIPAVFVESTVSDRNIKALIEGAKARGHIVKIGGSLFSDAMGKPGTVKGTYIGMIEHNAKTIAEALGGTASW